MYLQVDHKRLMSLRSCLACTCLAKNQKYPEPGIRHGDCCKPIEHFPILLCDLSVQGHLVALVRCRMLSIHELRIALYASHSVVYEFQILHTNTEGVSKQEDRVWRGDTRPRC